MKVVICGAGIAGLTLGWWLARDGWDVVIIEKAAAVRDEGYMIDFMSSGWDVAAGSSLGTAGYCSEEPDSAGRAAAWTQLRTDRHRSFPMTVVNTLSRKYGCDKRLVSD